MYATSEYARAKLIFSYHLRHSRAPRLTTHSFTHMGPADSDIYLMPSVLRFRRNSFGPRRTARSDGHARPSLALDYLQVALEEHLFGDNLTLGLWSWQDFGSLCRTDSSTIQQFLTGKRTQRYPPPLLRFPVIFRRLPPPCEPQPSPSPPRQIRGPLL